MSNRLAKLRWDAGYRSAAVFAEHVGIPVGTYMQYENAADSTTIPPTNLLRISNALGCNIADIFVSPELTKAQSKLIEKFSELSPERQHMLLKYLEYLRTAENV